VYKTQPKGSDDELSSDESDRDDEMEETLSKKPELNAAIVPHHGCVNRLRFHFVGDKPYVATWSELRKVCIWDLTVPLRVLENVEVMEITFRHVVVFHKSESLKRTFSLQQLQEYIKSKDKPKPVFTFKGHREEGFALDWSTTMPGKEKTFILK
jgi:ribosome assembly protein RRB1